MAASTLLGPVPAPHKTKQFWIVVTVFVLVAICAPFLQSLLGLPPFPRHVQISSAVIMLLVMIPAAWLAFRFGRVGWFTIGLIMFVFGLWARSRA